MRRIALALILCGLLALPTGGAVPIRNQGPITLVAYHMDDRGTLLGWTPVAGAVEYNIYRGTDPTQLVHVGSTDGILFFDTAREAEAFVFYAVTATDLSGTETSPSHVGVRTRGDCVSTSASFSVTVTLKDCMP